MIAIPPVDNVDIAFGNIKHMPKYEDLPEAFQDWHYEPHCKAISSWFYKGAESCKNGIRIDGKDYIAKPGVNVGNALAAIKSIMSSWEPKHEHKIGACGYLLSEWFDEVKS